MKIDAKIKMYGWNGEVFDETVVVDLDYVEDGEEVISWVEEEIWNEYGDGWWYGRDFSITNLEEIEEEIFS